MTNRIGKVTIRELSAADLGRHYKTRRKSWLEQEYEFRNGRDQRQKVSLARVRWLEQPELSNPPVTKGVGDD